MEWNADKGDNISFNLLKRISFTKLVPSFQQHSWTIFVILNTRNNIRVLEKIAKQ